MPGPRDSYSETLTYVDATSGNLKPLNNADVEVRLAGTTTKATIYTSRDPNISTQLANPFVTPSTGLAEFFVEAGQYEVVVTDRTAPARTAARTFVFNSTPAGAAAIPSAYIAGDAGLDWAAFSAAAAAQAVPIGGSILWWRPAATVPVPAGYEVADGRTLTAGSGAGQHQFPGISGSVNLPDSRNAFILGANVALTDGTAGTAASGAANAPGIGGTGGAMTTSVPAHTHGLASHTHTIAHTHTLSAHTHTIAHTHDHSHTHGMGNHTHGVGMDAAGAHGHNLGTATRGNSNVAVGSYPESIAFTNHVHSVDSQGSHTHNTWTGGPSTNTTDGASPSSTGGSSAASSGGPSSDVTGASSAASSGGPSVADTLANTAVTLDNRPVYIGWLIIMKVRRTI